MLAKHVQNKFVRQKTLIFLPKIHLKILNNYWNKLLSTEKYPNNINEIKKVLRNVSKISKHMSKNETIWKCNVHFFFKTFQSLNKICKEIKGNGTFPKHLRV